MLEIYGKSYCDWCTKAVELANSYNLNHTYYNCDNNVNALLFVNDFLRLKHFHKFGGTANTLVVIKRLLKKYKIQLAITDRGLSSHG